MEVQVRGGFSDRNNIDKISTTMQLGDINERTRSAIQNRLNILYTANFKKKRWDDPTLQYFIKDICANVYGEMVDYRELHDDDVFWKSIKDTIISQPYDQVLTLVEYFINHLDIGVKFDEMNEVFKNEYVGYRFVGGLITPITDEAEIEAVEEAMSNPHEKVKEHIHKALKFLSDREKPDYENSIKESISAVEAMCGLIVGETTTLGNALKKLEDKGVAIHGSLKSAFLKLYGYASDANGIRHAGNIDSPSATFAEAEYMAVTCSAFVNYLITLQSDFD